MSNGFAFNKDDFGGKLTRIKDGSMPNFRCVTSGEFPVTVHRESGDGGEPGKVLWWLIDEIVDENTDSAITDPHLANSGEHLCGLLRLDSGAAIDPQVSSVTSSVPRPISDVVKDLRSPTDELRWAAEESVMLNMANELREREGYSEAADVKHVKIQIEWITSDLPAGHVNLSERLVGEGWNGGTFVMQPAGMGFWRTDDVGDVNDPDSMATLSVHGITWAHCGIKIPRTVVEKISAGDVVMLEQLFKDAASRYSKEGRSVEVLHVAHASVEPTTMAGNQAAEQSA